MPSTKADIPADFDRGESVGLMQPLLIGGESRRRVELTDLAVALAARSAGLRRSLPDTIVAALAALVRSMNCYYSNLIEGHDTHPVDIERALREEFSGDRRRRDLQLEARAHIAVQQWIDEGGLDRPATDTASVIDIHRRFCTALPDNLSWVDAPDSGRRVRVVPGALRQEDVRVGRHVSISPGAVPRFLSEFERAHQRLGRTETILGAAAAHHRLLWIHPFLDGNGRVARLVSHASLARALESGSIWSIARGLARREQTYKRHLAECDLSRRNDLDGRGNLSEEALVDFTRFFLETCLDQVDFMEGLVQPQRLKANILAWASDEMRLGRLPPKAGALLEAVLYRGGLIPKSETADVLGVQLRHARRVTAALIGQGVLVSESARAPLRLAFPATLAARWMPGLFPDLPASA